MGSFGVKSTVIGVVKAEVVELGEGIDNVNMSGISITKATISIQPHRFN